VRILSFYRSVPLKILRGFKYLHMTAGLAIWLLTRFVVIFGTYLFWKKHESILLLIYAVVETTAFLAVATSLQMRSLRSEEEVLNGLTPGLQTSLMGEEGSLSDEVANILKDIRSLMTTDELKQKYSGRIILIFKNGVYNLTNYSHPGGDWRFREANWSEVSRYLFGISGIESDGSEAWKHSRDAFKVLSSRLIGNLYEKGSDNPDNWALKATKNGEVVFSNVDWTLSQKKVISQTTSLFKWRNQDFKVETGSPGYRWMGKHYMLSKQSKTSKIRIYTHCVSLADEIHAYDAKAVEQFFRRLRGDSDLVLPELPRFLDYLPTVIKRYESTDGISKTVHDMETGDTMKVEGPFGRGFILDEDLEGDVIIVAGGTGILPFVDFLNFLLKKAMARVLSDKQLNNDFILPKQNYLKPFSGARFHLFCAFRTDDDFVFSDVVDNLVKINDEFGLKMFRCVARIDKSEKSYAFQLHKGYFDKQFFLSNMKDVNNIQNVLVCGPEKMHSQIFDTLHKQLKLPGNRISYV
jgi:NAD(P)H-flavin reductase